ncbi:putative glycolipid-binding domain-containing protein [Microbacterium sp. CIAB417]|uniref:putative glycolipid-binding domain-containing protein n=1 Tax=Microbacterium sp. CIAB417 TaxID=2860287 RepID=UPI001FAB5E41|nr:putative glycolipid-binding domain-containing protein [Microbacterium sp. CIAB417]
MRLSALPEAASWNHHSGRVGFEVAFFRAAQDGHRLTGHTTAHESPVCWSVGYDIRVDRAWRTRAVSAIGLSVAGERTVTAARDEENRWTVDGVRRPDLDGCVDVDLESSAVTNTLPVHRIDFRVGVGVDLPAVFIRADDLRVERLDQRYTLIDASADRPVLHYESSTFDVSCELQLDGAGLVLAYPGIATRDG